MELRATLPTRGPTSNGSARISLSGARNAFTGEIGKGSDGRAASAIARDYRTRGYGGSSWATRTMERGAVASTPRLLNGIAVIARSFARIHETNLKKQGLLALTFADSRDYDRIREHDRLSLLEFDELSPGRRVRCIALHADGTRETLELGHSYASSQLDWFRAGSALNVAGSTSPR